MNNNKILFFVKTPPPITGATIINKQIADSKKIQSAFITRSIRLSYAKQASDMGKFNFSKPLRVIKYWFQLLINLLTFRPKYVYFQLSPFNAGFFRDLLYVALIKLFKSRVIIHLHGKGIQHKAQSSVIYRYLYQFVFRKSHVIHLSSKLAYDLKDVYKGKIYFLPNGIKESSKNPSTESSGLIQILFVSNLFVSKGVLILLEALKILKQNNYKFECTIVGDEGDLSLESLQKQIENLELSNQIFIVGPKFGNDKYPYFNSADIFIHPTLSDCFPLVLLEAMSSGLPVIATNEGAISDMIIDGVNGFILKKNDPQQIARKIECLLDNPKLMEEMGKKGKEKFDQEFTIDIFEKNMITVLNQIIKE